jgi:ribosome-binding factor A
VSVSAGRKARVEQGLRDTLAEMIAREVKDPRVKAAGLVSVTRVECNVDLSVARVYVSIYGADAVADKAVAGLAAAAGFLRGPAGRALGLAHPPELRFLRDVTPEVSLQLAEIVRDDEERARAAGRVVGQASPIDTGPTELAPPPIMPLAHIDTGPTDLMPDVPDVTLESSPVDDETGDSVDAIDADDPDDPDEEATTERPAALPPSQRPASQRPPSQRGSSQRPPSQGPRGSRRQTSDDADSGADTGVVDPGGRRGRLASDTGHPDDTRDEPTRDLSRSSDDPTADLHPASPSRPGTGEGEP